MCRQLSSVRFDEAIHVVTGQDARLQQSLELLEERGLDGRMVIDRLMTFSVAVPSWALGAGGTRFGRFAIGGEPRNLREKLDDVAAINRMTRANGAVSLHVPWDLPDDAGSIRDYAASLGLSFDAMNSNTFQDHPETTRDGAISYKFGSLAHTDAAVREAAIEHNLSVIEIGRHLGSTALGS